jgi:hypothetical protein
MSPGLSPAALRSLGQFLIQSPSLALATCDAAGRSEMVRAAAARITPAGKLRILVPLPEGARSLANIEATGRVALTAAIVSTYRTLQVKGSGALLVPWPEQAEVARESLLGLSAQLTNVGMPRELHFRLWSGRQQAIELTPSELYEQTPGPGAGLAVSG